jgi:cyclopropane fatty-acyl-phospholipid synthase-like methyltransferase
LSNSATQKTYIDSVAKARGLSNVEVRASGVPLKPTLTISQIVTGDVNVFDFDSGTLFDRILSIEVCYSTVPRHVLVNATLYQMFEHMKNYELLMRKVASWLRPTSPEDTNESLLFVHIFCHKTTPYHFEDDDGWMAQTFFTSKIPDILFRVSA